MAEVGCPSSSLRSGLWEFSAALAPRQTRAAPVFCSTCMTLSQSSVAMLCSSGSPLTSPFTLRALRSAACLTVCSARSSTKVSTFSLLQTAPRPLSGDGVVGEMSLECCHTRQSSSGAGRTSISRTADYAANPATPRPPPTAHPLTALPHLTDVMDICVYLVSGSHSGCRFTSWRR